MPDFWLSSGHHLLDRDEGGGLLVTDEFLKIYLARPELAPPPDACVAERSLHAALLGNPRRPVTVSEIAAITDADARENWSFMTSFRDRLIRHKTVEAAYLDLVRRYHPDKNGGDRSHEKALQAVIEAYTALKSRPAFA